jgi:hypothetical protein
MWTVSSEIHLPPTSAFIPFSFYNISLPPPPFTRRTCTYCHFLLWFLSPPLPPPPFPSPLFLPTPWLIPHLSSS